MNAQQTETMFVKTVSATEIVVAVGHGIERLYHIFERDTNEECSTFATEWVLSSTPSEETVKSFYGLSGFQIAQGSMVEDFCPDCFECPIVLTFDFNAPQNPLVPASAYFVGF